MYRDARHFTNRLYELVETGELCWEDIAKVCLRWLSEGEVEAMCEEHSNTSFMGLFEEFDDDN